MKVPTLVSTVYTVDIHNYHISVMQLVHLLTRSGLAYPVVDIHFYKTFI